MGNAGISVLIQKRLFFETLQKRTTSKVRGSLNPNCGVRHTLTWRAAAWHLHIELDSVHAQDGVTDVTEHVVAGFHTHESWQLEQLLQLGLPPYEKNFYRQCEMTRTLSELTRQNFITKSHLLGSERSILVPNLMIFPTVFCSELGKGTTSEIRIAKSAKQ